MRKLLNGILASSLILSMGTVSFATEVVNDEGAVYTQTLTASESDFTMGDGGIITKYTGSGGNVVIPSTIGGRTVYGIGEKAFENVTSLDAVTMPSTLERIEANAFDGCTNLRSVNLNEGLYYIGDRAFKNNTNLSSIWIPSTVTDIQYAAFCYTGLTSVYIPATVRSVGTSLFYECPRLKSVIFMADVDTLPEATFIHCGLLEDIYLSEEIVAIGNNAFQNCTSLREITLPSTTKSIGEYAFAGCSKLGKMDLTNTVLDSVANGAFQNCVSLSEVIFPYGFRGFAVANLGNYKGKEQFNGCTSLVKVVLPSTATSLCDYSSVVYYGVHPFTNCNASLVLYGYADTEAQSFTEIANTPGWSSLGSVSLENTNPTIIPTTVPTLPTGPDSAVTPSTPTPEVTPEVTTPQVDNSNKTALPSTAKVMVNGASVAFGAYEIDGFNYFKLTDMAYAIDGTSKQFEVTWDANAGAINMKIGNPHLVLGSELQGNSGQTETAERLTGPVLKNNSIIDVVVYSINGSSYFQLDTLKGVLGLTVGWDGATGTITINT